MQPAVWVPGTLVSRALFLPKVWEGELYKADKTLSKGSQGRKVLIKMCHIETWFCTPVLELTSHTKNQPRKVLPSNRKGKTVALLSPTLLPQMS